MARDIALSRSQAWERRRLDLNHDRIKNEYLQTLGSWVNVLAGTVSRDDLERTYVHETLPKWRALEQEAKALLLEAEHVLSPARILEGSSLPEQDPETLRWLGEIAHQMWLKRYEVRSIIAAAMDALRAADSAYSGLQEALRKCENVTSADALRPLLPQFQAFEQACERASDAIGKLPHRIMVI